MGGGSGVGGVCFVGSFFFLKGRNFVFSPYNSSLVHSSVSARADFVWTGP